MENSSLDNPGIYVLNESLKVLKDVGIERINAHVRELYKVLRQGLADLGYPVITPAAEAEHLGIVSMRPADPQAMFAFFRSRNIALSIAGGTHVRFSLGGFSTMADIEAVLAAAREYDGR